MNELIASRCVLRRPHFGGGTHLIYDLGNGFGLSFVSWAAGSIWAPYEVAVVNGVTSDGRFNGFARNTPLGAEVRSFDTATEANDFLLRAFAWADETRRVAETETAALFARLGVKTKEN